MTQENRKVGLRALLALAIVAIVGAGGFYFFSTEAGAAAPDSDTKTDAETADAAGTDGKEEDDEASAVPVEVAAAQSGDIAAYITATANLVPEREVTVLAESEGRVTEMSVEEGDRVSRGRLLVAIDRGESRIALKTAEIKASDARMAFERAERTFAQDLISREDLDKLSLENEVALQELEEAKWKLNRAAARAPFAGRIVSRTVQLGQHVKAGDELFKLADFDPLVARIYLPERDVLALREGQAAQVALQANGEVRFAGRIRQISPVVDTATGTVKVTVEATEVPALVRPGAFVTIGIVREQRSKAILVPREAVVRELQQAFVYVASDGGADRASETASRVAEKRPVELGLEEQGLVEALSGLQAGESVVVAGHGTLKNGSAIKILSEDSTADT